MSLGPRAVELMHAKIDGTVSEDENEELTRFLKKDPELQEHFFELQRVADALDGMTRLAPPASLRAAVLAAIGSTPAARTRDDPSRGRVILRYACAAAAGLILGLLGYHVAVLGPLLRSTVDPADFAGTMSVQPAAAEPEIVDEIVLELPAVHGRAQLETMDSHVLVRVNLDSVTTLNVVLKFDDRGLAFRDFLQREGEVDSLHIDGNAVAWTQRGPHRVTTLFAARRNTRSAIDLQLFESGNSVYRGTLETPGPE